MNAAVAPRPEPRRIFVNAVDDPANASAYLGGVIRRAGVTIAISTSGDGAGACRRPARGIDALLPPDLDRWAECARDKRRAWKRRRRADGANAVPN